MTSQSRHWDVAQQKNLGTLSEHDRVGSINGTAWQTQGHNEPGYLGIFGRAKRCAVP